MLCFPIFSLHIHHRCRRVMAVHEWDDGTYKGKSDSTYRGLFANKAARNSYFDAVINFLRIHLASSIIKKTFAAFKILDYRFFIEVEPGIIFVSICLICVAIESPFHGPRCKGLELDPV